MPSISQDELVVRGARAHNLRNISVSMPRNSMIVFSGLSGSGKSSLAFDTIFAEGQRRYIESLSSYARQFLGQVDRPDVDFIEGLSPAVSIDQKSTSRNPRSTVGTITEIYDYMRLLWARAGTPHCPVCGEVITSQSVQSIVDSVMVLPAGTRYQVLAPVVDAKKGEFQDLFQRLAASGFARALVDGQRIELSDPPKLAKQKKHTISVIVDRLVAKDGIETRLTDSIETALGLAEGVVIVDQVDNPDASRKYAEALSCPQGHEVTLTEIEPRTFSFNAPFGACPTCAGLGTKMAVDMDLIIGDPSLSVSEGVILPWATQGKSVYKFTEHMLTSLAEDLHFDLNEPWEDLREDVKDTLLHGKDFKLKVRYRNRFGREVKYTSGFEGAIPWVERRYTEAETDHAREWLGGFMREIPCASCGGKRLKPEVLAVKVGGASIWDVCDMPLDKALEFVSTLQLDEKRSKIAAPVVREIRARLQFLVEVGLHYLNMARSAGSLSGGEAQRIRLATQIGSGLTGVLYVLDEPSIGLHQRDNERLIETLLKLRDMGNTLIVVEHDEDTMKAADWIVDIGPKAGVEGGRVIHSGSYSDLLKNPESITGDYLAGRRRIAIPTKRRKPKGKALKVIGAQANNLKNIDVQFPLGVMTVVSGVSGSGKSSLVNDILYRVMANKLNGARAAAAKHKRVTGLEQLDKVIHVDQAPIGRTPRSNPATYTGVFDHIRKLFAQTPEAQLRGYQAGRFSFNVKGGRCEACSGDGTIKVEMNFLPDVYVECEICHGARYNRDTLAVKYKGKTIADVLNMSIKEAEQFFAAIGTIHRHLKTLVDVGLGYIKLGQAATTLSGGESQRVKLATELQKRSTGKTVYVLDEPTTGLHFYDVQKLLDVLSSLVDKGNTVIVIEHNLDVIKSADWIIDMGPEGGAGGGTVIATGTPEQVAKVPESFTGQFLAGMLRKA